MPSTESTGAILDWIAADYQLPTPTYLLHFQPEMLVAAQIGFWGQFVGRMV
jgi:hypothetical protein